MGKQIADVDEYSRVELGVRYRANAEPSTQRPALTTAQITALEQDGYVIVENLIPADICVAIRDSVRPLFEHESGRNNFEGMQTQRLYALFEKTLQCNPWIEHALALSLLEQVLDPNPLLSQAQIINILPDEKAQPWHADDAFYRWPRPRPALGAATIFALDEFTADNGATVLIPGSHLWDERRPEPADIAHAVTAEMPQGSMLFFSGTLWHHAGANRSHAPRMCLTAQYCMPWCRQQENYALSVSRETAKKCSPTLRAMLGYSIYKPFMGMVDGKHPLRLLE